MKHKTTARFWNHFDALPGPVREIARKNYPILKENPHHPSLRFKKVGKLWSARVGRDHRALAMEDESGYVWVWIGTHENMIACFMSNQPNLRLKGERAPQASR